MASKDVVVALTIDPRFARLLTRQDDLQAFLLGVRVVDLDNEKMAEYIRTQAYAAVAEIVEAVDETHWKPWSIQPVDAGMIPSRKRFIGELADVFIFFMNLMLAGQVTMNELADAVNTKQDKNLVRWTNGYDAKATKCRGCGRSFDDEDVKCYSATTTTSNNKVQAILTFCSDKGRFIDSEGNPVG